MVSISKKQALTVLVTVALLLCIPLVAMQFSSEVNWNMLDFGIAALLLAGCGFLISFLLNQPLISKYRWSVIAGVVLLFFLLWAEMAVGLFGSPLAGS